MNEREKYLIKNKKYITCCLLNQGKAIIWKFKWVILRLLFGGVNGCFDVPNGKWGDTKGFTRQEFLFTYICSQVWR